MSQTSDNNKRIAKNTLYLYIRQIFVMLVALYTSRVVLATLGETDYGIYNVVGGIVSLFTILNFAMGCATNRFITFELGKSDQNGVNSAFSNAIIIHIIIAIIILILGETLGLYFFNTQMNIPQDRIYAAKWVYQFSIFTCMVNILSIPYNALITSHEKMNAFAIISVIETVLKLLIVWVLLIFRDDKLILYSILMFLVGVFIRALNQWYARKTFRKVRFIWCKNNKMLKEMISYGTWSLLGSAGVVLTDQGQNIILNIFFGPAVNAARGIAMQVKSAVVNLSNNFGQAISPQINKSFASGNVNYMHKLIFVSSKYTFYLLFVMVLPIILEAKNILSLWLVDVPNHAVTFLQLMLVISLLTILGNPLSNAAGANGNIRNFQLIVGGINLFLLPITWIVFKIQDLPIPEWAFYTQIIVCLIAQLARLILVRPLINLSLRSYIQEVVSPCTLVLLTSSVIPVVMKAFLKESIWNSMIIVVFSVVSVIVSVFLFGMTKNERQLVLIKIPLLKNDKCN